jgi:acyl carrier protein
MNEPTQDYLPLVQEILSEYLDFDKNDITPDKYIIGDLGADSLDVVEILMEFEERLNITIEDERVQDFGTVGDILAYLTIHGDGKDKSVDDVVGELKDMTHDNYPRALDQFRSAGNLPTDETPTDSPAASLVWESEKKSEEVPEETVTRYTYHYHAQYKNAEGNYQYIDGIINSAAPIMTDADYTEVRNALLAEVEADVISICSFSLLHELTLTKPDDNFKFPLGRISRETATPSI